MVRAWACVGWNMGETTIPHVCIYYKEGLEAETQFYHKFIGKAATPENVQKAFDELAVGVKEDCFKATPLHERERLFLRRYAKILEREDDTKT